MQLCRTRGYEYSGFGDPTRMSAEDISDKRVEELLGRFFKNYQGVPKFDESVQAYDNRHKPREVIYPLVLLLSTHNW